MKEKSKRGRKKKEPDYNNVFSVRLRELLDNKKISNTEFAYIMNVSPQMVSFWRNGDNIPDIKKVCIMADYFNVSIDYLLGRTDIATTQTDIHTACKVTGLSEVAINKIIMIGDFDKSIIDALNSFILTDCCVSLLMGFSMYENERNKK